MKYKKARREIRSIDLQIKHSKSNSLCGIENLSLLLNGAKSGGKHHHPSDSVPELVVTKQSTAPRREEKKVNSLEVNSMRRSKEGRGGKIVMPSMNFSAQNRAVYFKGQATVNRSSQGPSSEKKESEAPQGSIHACQAINVLVASRLAFRNNLPQMVKSD